MENGEHREAWDKGKLAGQKALLKPKVIWAISIHLQHAHAVRDLVSLRSEDFLFPSRLHGSPHVSTRQYARIVEHWVIAAGLNPYAYGTHSMRRTKAALIYKRTRNLRAVQLFLVGPAGHHKSEWLLTRDRNPCPPPCAHKPCLLVGKWRFPRPTRVALSGIHADDSAFFRRQRGTQLPECRRCAWPGSRCPGAD